MRDRVRPGAATADLAAVAGGGAVLRAELAGVVRPERREHRQRRLVAGPQAGLCLGRTRHGVLLEQPVGVLAPACALPDQLDLGLALPGHRALDHVRQRRDARAGHLGERRALVAEDPRVAVGVGADPVPDPQVGEHACPDQHRVLGARVLGVRLDPVETRLLPRALDLELRHEDSHLAGHVLREGDRPLVRQEAEAGRVLDVGLVEEDDAAQALRAGVLEQALAPLRELGRRDARRLHDSDDIGLTASARP